MLGLGSSLFTESVVGGDTKLAVAVVTVVASDDENVRILLTVNDVPTQNALLSGITQSSGAKVNGTCTVKVQNATEYGSDLSEAGIDTFNIFQFLSISSQYFFLSLATSDITISSVDDYEQVNLTLNSWLDSSGADAELDVTGSSAGFLFFDLTIDLGAGFEVSSAAETVIVSIDAA